MRIKRKIVIRLHIVRLVVGWNSPGKTFPPFVVPINGFTNFNRSLADTVASIFVASLTSLTTFRGLAAAATPTKTKKLPRRMALRIRPVLVEDKSLEAGGACVASKPE